MLHYGRKDGDGDGVKAGAVFEGREIYRSTRLEKLRARVFEATPQIDSSRARAVTESYQETEGLPVPIRRAKALRRTLETLPIRINEGELVVGEIAPYDRCAQVYPDYGIDWFIEELDGKPFRFEDRPGDKFVISPEDEEQIRKIAPYWKGKTHKDHVYARIPKEAWDAFEIGMIDTDYLVICAEGHVIVNLQRVLREALLTAEFNNMMYEDARQTQPPETIKNAMIVVAVLPILCVYPFIQKYFVKGVMIGSMKG